jgi:hypothetical protein
MFKFHITINQTISLEADGGQKVHHCAPSDEVQMGYSITMLLELERSGWNYYLVERLKAIFSMAMRTMTMDKLQT